MSIRKVSDLPGIDDRSSEWDIEKFKDSIFEISYVSSDASPYISDANPHRYKSMYINCTKFSEALISAGNLIDYVEDIVKKSIDGLSAVILRTWEP